MEYFVFALLLSLTSFYHNFHASITNGELSPKSHNLEMSMKLFTNDLEDAINSQNQVKLHLGEKNEYAKADSLIAKYVMDNFALKMNGKKLSTVFVGKELDYDVTFVFIKVSKPGPIKDLEVTNTLFFDRFDDQSNVVNIKVDDDLESEFFKKGKPTAVLHFNQY